MKISQRIRSLSRKTKLLVAIVALGAVVAVPLATRAEFYPARPTYDYNKYNGNNNCADPSNIALDHGRCGSMDGPVFNSFVNTPYYGDERAFFDGRRSDQSITSNADDITNVTEGSKEVVLRMYVHNNANQGTNCFANHKDANGVCTQIDNDAPGVAKNANVRIALPTATEQVLRARAYISASNAAMVEDTADLTAHEKFNVSYVPGSAKLIRNNVPYSLSDNIVTTGAPIGNTAMNGFLPGCFDYAALVEIHVKVNAQPTPNLQVVKEVKMKGVPGFKKQVAAKPGETIQWRIGTKDISNANLSNVTVRDVLPPHLKVVPGSVHIVDTSQDVYQSGTAPSLFGGGLILGNFVPSSTSYILFDTTALGDFSGCSVLVTNLAYAHSDQTPNEVNDSANATITKENCTPPPPTPSYTCDYLKATTGDNRMTTFTAGASASGGAQIKLYRYDFGDGTATLVTDKNVVQHQYAKDGQYAARVNVVFDVNGQNKVAGGDQCAVAVSFTTPSTPSTPGTTTSGTPGTLVNTGPGEVLGVFALTTAAGAIAYRWMLGRRLGSQ